MGWIIPDRNPAGTVYGVLVVGTLLAAENSQSIGYIRVLGATLVALVLYWLAHAYAAVLGQRLATTQRWSPRHLLEAMIHEFAIVCGAAPPILALLAAGLLGASVSQAIGIALATCAGWIILLEILAGVGEGLSALAVVIEALVGAALGLGLFAVKLLLH